VDNLFVFVVIMTTFAVPRERQQKVLIIGIALALRVIFIILGTALLSAFSGEQHDDEADLTAQAVVVTSSIRR